MTLTDWQIEQGKAEFLDDLYDASGRTNGLYTGLWDEHCRRCGESARNAWLAQRFGTRDPFFGPESWVFQYLNPIAPTPGAPAPMP